MNNSQKITILIAEDDEDDRLLMEEALEENDFINNIFFVENGEELMDYLYSRDKYQDKVEFPRPNIILLDLNMPKKDGREALKEIKSEPNFRSIPIIVLTTSKAQEDIVRSYDLGVNSFITKPVTFDSLVEIMKTFTQYWFTIVELP